MVDRSNFELYRKAKIKYVKWLPFNALAMVLFGKILALDEYLPDQVINHELIHVAQQKRLGYFKFYYRYLKEWLHNHRQYKDWTMAYRNISFEKEAYDNQNNLNYLDEIFPTL